MINEEVIRDKLRNSFSKYINGEFFDKTFNFHKIITLYEILTNNYLVCERIKCDKCENSYNIFSEESIKKISEEMIKE